MKMRRLSLVSSGILAIGLMAVFGAILYRALSADAGGYAVPIAPEDVAELVIEAAPGAEIAGVTATDEAVFVTLQGPDGAQVLHVDRATWQVVGRIEVQP